MYEMGSANGSPDKPLLLYVKACVAGDGLGCHMAGMKLLLGKGVTPDLDKAKRAFTGACSLGYADGCAMQGALLASQEQPPMNDALQLYKQGCNLGGALGCRFLGEAKLATDVPEDKAIARAYLELACQRGETEACSLAKPPAEPPPALPAEPTPAPEPTIPEPPPP
jgi:TPR repeat protein